MKRNDEGEFGFITNEDDEGFGAITDEPHDEITGGEHGIAPGGGDGGSAIGGTGPHDRLPRGGIAFRGHRD